MLRRIPVVLLLGVMAFTSACTNRKVHNPIANVNSQQPDKVLFDRAMSELKHNRFDVARIDLQTLINTYPDSEFLARAKLAVADSWYDQGGASAMAQAEAEYDDFITFFPNMPDAAEAQLKIANIHYQEMEKPDRDFTHAVRAEQEYRKVILQYPDNPKMVALAKARLLQVQEVIAEREYRVGRFYFLRDSYPAAIARLQSLVQAFPLYSKADEALYMLGQCYEGEIALIRQSRMSETNKAQFIQRFTKDAGQAYSEILTRYPVMDRADDAKARLEALHLPVPKATKEAIARNRAEENSRHPDGMMAHVMNVFSRKPDVSEAATVGEPTLVDPKEVSATQIEQENAQALHPNGVTTKNSLSGTIVGNSDDTSGAVPASEVAPGDADTGTDASSGNGNAAAGQSNANQLKPNVSSGSSDTSTSSDPNALKPNVTSGSSDPNELKPNVPQSGDQALPPPAQVNEIQPNQTTTGTQSQSGSTQQNQDDSTSSSSKHKKKKGLRKIF